MKKPVLIAVAVVVVLAVGGLVAYKVFLEDDAPAELGLTESTGSTSTTSGDGRGHPASIDGTWTVRSEEPTQAGMRIKESFLSGLADHTTVGRTSDGRGLADDRGDLGDRGVLHGGPGLPRVHRHPGRARRRQPVERHEGRRARDRRRSRTPPSR